MAVIVRMPSVLAGTSEAALSSWLVTPGDVVAVGTPLAEIETETEKAVVEYAAETAGVIGRLVLAAGETADTGDPIAVLVAAGETDPDIDAALGVTAPAAAGARASDVSATLPTPGDHQPAAVRHPRRRRGETATGRGRRRAARGDRHALHTVG